MKRLLPRPSSISSLIIFCVARLVEGRERSVDDQNVGSLHETPYQIDAGAFLRGEQAPGGAHLPVEPDPLDILQKIEFVDDRRNRFGDARLRVRHAIADAAEQQIVAHGRRGADAFGIVEFHARFDLLEFLAHQRPRAHELVLQIVVDETETVAGLDILQRQREQARPVFPCRATSSRAAAAQDRRRIPAAPRRR